jgi:hypothetical protein
MSKDRLFDPSAFLNDAVPANATRRDPLPIGEGIAQVVDLSFESGTVQKQSSKNYGLPWYRMDAKIQIDDPSYLRDIVGNDGNTPVFSTVRIMYDGLETGAPKSGPNVNVQLGRFREACGVNGKSLNALIGQRFRFVMSHKPHPSEPDVVLDEITGYTKA